MPSLVSSRFRFSLLLLAVALAVSIAGLLVLPAFAELRDAQRGVQIARAKYAREREIVDAFTELQAAVAEHADALARAELALPTPMTDASDPPDLLAAFEHLSEREAGGVFIVGITFGDKTVERGVSAASLPSLALAEKHIQVRGLASYESLKRFLDALQSSLRIFEPVQVTFDSKGPDEVASFSLNLRTFVQTP